MRISFLLLAIAFIGCSAEKAPIVLPAVEQLPTDLEALSQDLAASDSEAVNAVRLRHSACYGYTKVFDLATIDLQSGKVIDSFTAVEYNRIMKEATRKMFDSACATILRLDAEKSENLRPIYEEAKRFHKK